MKKFMVAVGLISITASSIAASASGKSDIQLVRKGALDWNPAVTVGSVLDSDLMSCSKKKWQRVTDNGNVFVQFSCTLPKDTSRLMQFKNVENTPTAKEVLAKYPKILDFQLKYKALFQIAKDKKSFRVVANDVVYEYSDGKNSGFFEQVYEKGVADYEKMVMMTIMSKSLQMPEGAQNPEKVNILQFVMTTKRPFRDGDMTEGVVHAPAVKEAILKEYAEGAYKNRK